MRIVIASTHVPFTHGGGNKIVEDLRDELVARGFQTEVVTIPFSSLWSDIPLQTIALRLFDLTEASGSRISRLIAIRYPAYAFRHQNKVAWFIHHHRGAYDLWNTEVGDMPDLPRGRHFRDMMHRSDGIYLRECRKLFTNSRVVANRVSRFNGIEPSGVLYPPLRRDHPFRPGEYGDYVYYVSRLEPIKRQNLAIEALAHAPSVRLVISGTSGQGPYLDTLKNLALELGVADRVHFTGWVSEQEKAEWMAGCCAALYLAHDEDSYGYATLEAFHAAKPVITLTDSGGPLEVIVDGLNGSVVPPSPAALGEAMTRYREDRSLARRLGREAQQTPGRHRIDWDHVVENLTA